MTDGELWKTRSMLLRALESEREVLRRYGGGPAAGGGKEKRALTGSKRARTEDEGEEEEEGQIRGVEGPPPAKAAKTGYVPPHMRGRGGDAERAAPGRSDGDWRGGGGASVGRADASKDWRRRDDGVKVGASGPKIPVPGERGFGFHSVGLGRGRGSVGGGRDLDGAGAGRTTSEAPNRTVPVPPPPAPRVERFDDVPAAPVEPTRQVQVPPPPPPAAKPVEKRRDASPARDAEESEEDDDIEAIQAAAKVATNVKVIEVEIPDPPEPKLQKAADGTAAAAPPPRRSSRRSVSPDRLKMESTAAEPKMRRSSRRSVEPEPSRKSAKTKDATKSSSLTPVEGDPSKLTVVVLKELLKERELSTAGLKAALVERLKAALEEEANA